MAQRTCTIDGCERAYYARGWCSIHYKRWHEHGDPGPAELLRAPRPDTCTIDGCSKAHLARGWCSMHWTRWRKHGDPMVVLPPGGAENFGDLSGVRSRHWKGDDIRYPAMHCRLRRQRGQASNHRCRTCGEQAREWAYDHKDPDEKLDLKDGRLVPYSLKPSHYMPLCVSCHRRLDSVSREVTQAEVS